MRKTYAAGAAATLLALAVPTGEAKAQIPWGYGGSVTNNYGGPFNSGYGIYAPGYSQGLSLGFNVPYYGGYSMPYSYGGYRPSYGGVYGYRSNYAGYGYRPSYGGYGYRGGYYGRRR